MTTAGAAPEMTAGPIFQFSSFADLPLRHAMSLRRGDRPSEGDIGFARNTNAEHVRANRAEFLAEAGIDPAALTLGRQIHGNGVLLVTAAERGRGQPPAFDAIPDADGLMTRDPAVAPGVIVADCVPILLYDPVRHAVTVLHAGWRGTVAGITSTGVKRMAAAFGTKPGDIRAGIGPSIGPCCYEVGGDVIEAWRERGVSGAAQAIVARDPRDHLDLWRANVLCLVAAGVPEPNIEIAAACTRCHGKDYFSHRAWLAGERPRGRMIMVAQLEARA